MVFGEFMTRLLTHGLEAFSIYYGVYRGQVKANQDPDNLGRIQVHVPQVHGPDYPRVWAWPLSPMGGSQAGLWHTPDVGEYVYVMFDHGRAEFPLWVGSWWGEGDCSDDMTKDKVVLRTKEGLRVVLDRSAKSVLVEVSEGNSVLVTGDQIHVKSSSKVTLEATHVNVEGDLTVNGKSNLNGDVAVSGNGNVNGNWIDSGNNTAHHTHPVVNGVAIRQ